MAVMRNFLHTLKLWIVRVHAEWYTGGNGIALSLGVVEEEDV